MQLVVYNSCHSEIKRVKLNLKLKNNVALIFKFSANKKILKNFRNLVHSLYLIKGSHNQITFNLSQLKFNIFLRFSLQPKRIVGYLNKETIDGLV